MNDFVWPVRIYYEDTDAGGVVYHANYLRFMERARNEWLRDLGRPIDKIVEQDKCLFVVRSLEMKFVRPAKLGDEILISAQIVSRKKASMVLQQAVHRETAGTGELLVNAKVELAIVSSETFRPVAMPKFLQTLNID